MLSRVTRQQLESDSRMTRKRTYPLATYQEKVLSSLKHLEDTQAPLGELGGKGTKTRVLELSKDRLIALHKKGYTAEQIAAALSTTDFEIKAKTITEVIGVQKKKAETKLPAEKKALKQTPESTQEITPNPTQKPPTLVMTDVE